MKLKTIHLLHHEIDTTKWDNFIDASPQSYIYLKSWYLNVLNNNWSAIIVQHGSSWKAVMPLTTKIKYGIGYALQPIFTQYLGIALAPSYAQKHHQIFEKNSVANEIIKAIPGAIRLFDYNFHPSYNAFLPFTRNNYTVTPRITYRMSLEDTYTSLSCFFSSSILNHLKKAAKEGLQCFDDESEVRMLEIMLKRKIIKTNDAVVFKKLWLEIKKHNNGFIMYVKDKTGNIHCGAAFVIDGNKMIMLMSVVDNKLKRSGANALLITESLKRAFNMGTIKHLDFKGSCLENVEQYLRGFNPDTLVYYSFRKNKLSLITKFAYQMGISMRAASILG